jgi:hypothetical protein
LFFHKGLTIQLFYNLTQYGGHHIDIDEKKVELFHKGLTIQLQDRLILFQSLSYNELVSAVIDQENTIRACEAFEEKKRKMTMSGSSRCGSNGAPLKYRIVYTPPIGQSRHPPQLWGNCPQLYQ